MTGRNAMLLGGLSKDDALIEIGPSFAPVAPKRDGWRTVVVDHASREDLVAKYTGLPHVDPAQIEEVDRIWTGGPLDALFPAAEHGTYRALLASHVIEHIPDPISFYALAARLLHPTEGVLSLAVPDKRWCFDLLKPPSTTGQVLAAHRARATRHAPATRFDHAAYYADDAGRPSWGREKLPGLRLMVSLEAAKASFDAWSDASDAPYVDCHAWHFTPASFELLILELGALGLVDWHVDWIAPQPAVEFLVHLRRGARRFASPEAREAERLVLLRRMFLELREQTDWMLEGGPPAPVPAPAQTNIEARLDTIDARLRHIADATLPEIALTASQARQAMRPARAVWRRLLPLRQVVARLRGRG